MKKEDILKKLQEKKEEAMKQMKSGKKITEAAVDAVKLKTLSKSYPEVADAAAKVVRSFMENPQRPLKMTINKVIEETGVSRSVLMKMLDELGLNVTE